MKGRGGVVFTCSLLPPDADADASGGPWRSRGKEDKTMDSGSGSRASLDGMPGE